MVGEPCLGSRLKYAVSTRTFPQEHDQDPHLLQLQMPQKYPGGGGHPEIFWEAFGTAEKVMC